MDDKKMDNKQFFMHAGSILRVGLKSNAITLKMCS